MCDIVIAKARVIGVEEVNLKPHPTVADPTGEFWKVKKVIASKLRIDPPDDAPEPDGYSAIHGDITVPQLLPFGVTFDLVLRERNGLLIKENGRKFQEDI
ncbi:MAG TPA: hypothetical protein VJ476_05950 [Rhizomicrobium sp.]|nr:hypothetical protein [Rhizomicrobium sp.]